MSASIPILTGEKQLALLEQLSQSEGAGLSLASYIEQAGAYCAKAGIESLKRHMSEDTSVASAIVLCGTGVNGSIGLSTACALQKEGCLMRVEACAVTQGTTEEWRAFYAACEAAGVTLLDHILDWSEYDLCVDALTGCDFHITDPDGVSVPEPLKTTLEDAAYEITGMSNRLLVMAVDCPSGVDCNTTEFPAVCYGQKGFSPIAILPDVLVSLIAAKPSGMAARQRAITDGRHFVHYVSQGMVPEAILREKGLWFNTQAGKGITLIESVDGKATRLQTCSSRYIPRIYMALGGERLASNTAIITFRKNLPIYEKRQEIISVLRENHVLVLISETGSGKSTQIPQYLVETEIVRPNKAVVVTEPRRIAAISLASRVAEETASGRVGGKVGYIVRFEKKISQNTQILFATDGMVLREFARDPTLANFDAIVIDEAHERSISSDALLGLVSLLRRQRPDIRVVIASATIDETPYRRLFGDDYRVVRSSGKLHPVSCMYAAHPYNSIVAAMAGAIWQAHTTRSLDEGHILAFMTGQDDISQVCELLQAHVDAQKDDQHLLVLPCYAALPASQQALIFRPAPPGTRKVIVATNVAETSLTIDGVGIVIDSGLEKMNWFDSSDGSEKLSVMPISQASATQRAGRAGRTRDGVCLRLFTEAYFRDNMAPYSEPEIMRTRLTPLMLQLLSLSGVKLSEYPWLQPPPRSALVFALTELHSLRLVDSSGSLTERGRIASLMPVDPRIAVTLIEAARMGRSVLSLVLDIASVLSAQGEVLVYPRGKQALASARHAVFSHAGSDLLSLGSIFRSWCATLDGESRGRKFSNDNYLDQRVLERAHNVRRQLDALAQQYLSPGDTTQGSLDALVLRAFTSGYFLNTACLESGGYMTLRPHSNVYLAPHSFVKRLQPPPPCIMFVTLRAAEKNYATLASAVDPKWILEAANETEWLTNSVRKRLQAKAAFSVVQ